MSRRKGSHILSPSEVIGIYRSPFLGKTTAIDFGVSTTTVSWIKNGKRHGQIVRAWEETAAMNATLISAAFGVLQ